MKLPSGFWAGVIVSAVAFILAVLIGGVAIK